MRRLVAGVALAAALLVPTTGAAADESSRVGMTRCPGGFYLWYYDLQNKQQIIFSTCIYP